MKRKGWSRCLFHSTRRCRCYKDNSFESKCRKKKQGGQFASNLYETISAEVIRSFYSIWLCSKHDESYNFFKVGKRDFSCIKDFLHTSYSSYARIRKREALLRFEDKFEGIVLDFLVELAKNSKLLSSYCEDLFDRAKYSKKIEERRIE